MRRFILLLGLVATVGLVVAATGAGAPPPKLMSVTSSTGDACNSVTTAVSWENVHVARVRFDYMLGDLQTTYEVWEDVSPRPSRSGSLENTLANDGRFVDGVGAVTAMFYDRQGDELSADAASFELTGC
jgi:hypothetical protein